MNPALPLSTDHGLTRVEVPEVALRELILLFLLVLLGVGYFLYRALVGGRILEHDRALEGLRTAYARGDLTTEEFEQRRQRLRRDRE